METTELQEASFHDSGIALSGQELNGITAAIERLRHLFDVIDDDDVTQLHLAIANGDHAAIQYLIAVAFSCGWSRLLDIQTRKHRQTAVHMAVAVDRPSIVRLLVLAGAATNLRDHRGQTPLMLACDRRHVECIKPLTQLVDDDERTPLRNYSADVGLFAFQQLPPPPTCPPDTNLLDYRGCTCLHHVQLWKSDSKLATTRLEVIDYLVNKCGANINIQEGLSGHTLLHLAIKERDDELFTYLLRHPSTDVNRQTYGRRTALDVACEIGDRQWMVQRLLDISAKHSPYW